MKRVAINGFGRIGRAFMRIAHENPDIEVVAVNDVALKTDLAAYLLLYDSIYGRFPGEEVTPTEKGLKVADREIPLLAEKDPAALPWKDMGIDVVIESTGVFRSAEKAGLHLQAGAKKVIISAPAKGSSVPTFVYGVNHEKYDKERDNVISAASCTTNCLSPIAKILNDEFGIEKGWMTTVHAYTADQRLVDMGHPEEWARGRGAAQNIVPTTTGAAVAVGLVLPELKGRFDGIALRVPTPTGSVTDLNAILQKSVTKEEINDAFRKYASGSMKPILKVSDLPLVSSDCVGDPHSAIVNLKSTSVLDGNFVKVLAYYDNEWGYSNRLVDLTLYI
ncbi:type I glyceraldehyde-3-phosphate dehydrogenase [Planktothrix sp. FACHB-1355]|uniref:Glyceraldehyde-3-phosphate dehydrogenase n=1 Tax=Aerosakkonema funiforme FACHB-1375 TaxID=2949571 RepID=A0A926ZGT4_9CYAN|nr:MULTISPECIES: type I glyceraldehyde-3-phosphate dehydrogenase [Oscillatoriales]MBD2180156.1 type I glyceraldehyde-3-phosphate dehydrogenase [Aerosakkonema funiforme FACHB-1375]MBD3562851.1 type I glyceraldehyde-3-phosphate dehydrogenase [Planktothrix sp. FACHB-1355]